MADTQFVGNWKLLTSENFDEYMKVSIIIFLTIKIFFVKYLIP
jgi:hypothetical protein